MRRLAKPLLLTTASVLFAVVWLSLPQSATALPVWTPINNGLTNLDARVVRVNPSDSTVAYVATVGGGVFVTTNRGVSWTPANEGLTSLNVYDLAIDPATPSTLYVGQQDGVSKTTDSASHWASVNNGLPDRHVTAIAVDPTNPTASDSTVYAGPDAYDIYRSWDAGASWTWSGGFRDTRQFAVDARNPGTAFSSTVNGVYKTTNWGNSWFSASTGLSSYITALEIHPFDSSTLYTSPTGSGDIYRTTNGGTSWSFLASVATDTINDFVIDPSDPDILYAAIGTQGVYRSTDGGASWTEFNAGLTNLNASGLAIDPMNPERVYVATYGGGVFALVPEPTTALLAACGLAGLALKRRRAP